MSSDSSDLSITEHRDYLEARISGRYTLAWLNDQITRAVDSCRKRKKSRLFLDLTPLAPEMSVLDRYKLGAHGADVAVSIKIAVLARPEVIDPQKFAVQVARNRGLQVDAFSDRDEALRWLLERPEKTP